MEKSNEFSLLPRATVAYPSAQITFQHLTTNVQKHKLTKLAQKSRAVPTKLVARKDKNVNLYLDYGTLVLTTWYMIRYSPTVSRG